jgi:hypothetical protein
MERADITFITTVASTAAALLTIYLALKHEETRAVLPLILIASFIIASYTR